MRKVLFMLAAVALLGAGAFVGTAQADRFTPHLTLRASFDPELGFPRHYLRMEAGSTQDISWEVTRFEAR